MTTRSVLFSTAVLPILTAAACCRGQSLPPEALVPAAQVASAEQPERPGLIARYRERRRVRRASPAPAPASPPGSTAIANLSVDEPMPEMTPMRTCQVHVDLGRVHLSQGRHAHAASAFRQALEACPVRGTEAEILRALVHRKLAAALDAQGKLDEAVPHYEEALRLAPGDARVWNDAGYGAYLRGDWSTAETRLRRAVELAPDDPRIANNLGLALAAAGKSDAAFESLSRAGGPAAAEANLGYILAASGQEAAARRRYESALARRPELEVARTALTLLDDAPPIPDALPPDLIQALSSSAAAPADPDVTPTAFQGKHLPPLPR